MKINAKRILGVLIIVALNIGLDQISKAIARAELMGRPPRSFLGDLFRLGYVENRGAFLSIGAGLSDQLRYWALTVVPVFILSGLLLYTLFSRQLTRWQTLAFSFILGGGISNVYDRLLFGQVVDFMNLGIGSLRTGIFNFADVSIMVGLFMMLPFLFTNKKPEASGT